MSKEDGTPVADDYVASVGEWLASTDLSTLPESAEPVTLPPPGAPVTVVRPVRLPYEVDALVKALADARGTTMSDLIRDWIAAGLAAAGTAPDPVNELRRGLDAAQRALDVLVARPAPRQNAA
jgi:hypothetical protein